MQYFDRDNFENLMGRAVELHGAGQYEDALAVSTEAYHLAPSNSLEKGRAARDNSARTDRLGRIDEAGQWAQEAFNIHDSLVRTMPIPSREAYRERAVSAMYVGVSGLRKVIGSWLYGLPATVDEDGPLQHMRITWNDIGHAKDQVRRGIDRHVDQYEINAARRVSIAESLVGDRKRGLRIGARAVGLALLSESPRIDTSNPNLSPPQRMRAKIKAFVGGVAAVGVNVLASSHDERRQRAALKLADRTL